MGFDCEFMYFGDPNDSGDHAEIKTYGQLKGRDLNAPVLCFAGHTDVVPIGDESAWKFPPFSATVHEGKLYGRRCIRYENRDCKFCDCC